MPTYATYAQIKTELDTDPLVIGYAGMTDAAAADALNSLGNGAAVDVKTISSTDLQSVIDATEWSALTTNELLKWQTILNAGSIIINAVTKAQITSIWPLGTTRTRLAALQSRAGTRAEVLWGAGAVVSLHDVHVARRQA